ncbi:hypothetical protein HYC85_022626 [Camellia sinensis]|uniref:Uncharacterized protein n=1 Tax=Camellia sinensis TaxID=4442 RepID=A0A7J7GCT0_CAMSI|nr:hypothetical protein HYC85_022626 [Camellia sinensis]
MESVDYLLIRCRVARMVWLLTMLLDKHVERVSRRMKSKCLELHKHTDEAAAKVIARAEEQGQMIDSLHSSVRNFWERCKIWSKNSSLSQECTLDNLNIDQHRTQRIIQGKPEWNVTVTNNCKCGRLGIVLSCPGLKTVEVVDPAILKPTNDGRCLLIQYRILKPHDSVKFSYAWDPPILMLPQKALNFCGDKSSFSSSKATNNP